MPANQEQARFATILEGSVGRGNDFAVVKQKSRHRCVDACADEQTTNHRPRETETECVWVSEDAWVQIARNTMNLARWNRVVIKDRVVVFAFRGGWGFYRDSRGLL